MPIISASELTRRVRDVFGAADCPEHVSGRVAESLVEANLTGHDSHGVIRVPYYVRSVQSGRIQPRGEIRIVRESATTASLDCGHNFGQVGAARGVEVAVAKAQEHDIAVVALERCGHVGRLGEYVVMAAQQGLMGLMACNGLSQGGIVAPFGGIGRALGTNPIAWAVPGVEGKPIFLDYATSACAQGKIQVAADKGQELPEGWLLDKNGQPTRDPHDQFDGGVMLPFAQHKGYAMSVLVELLAGGLSGAGPALLPDYPRVQGAMLIALRIDAFQPVDAFREMAAEFSRLLKTTPRAPGCEEILLPGEPEWRSKEKRGSEGIPLPQKTWDRLQETAVSLGLEWD
ncbi:MAG: Ldh family oxidoreductase [Anaerolineae bacterium]|nr:Ldh family oxidoreductase [Anaerolineae bacterium]